MGKIEINVVYILAGVGVSIAIIGMLLLLMPMLFSSSRPKKPKVQRRRTDRGRRRPPKKLKRKKAKGKPKTTRKQLQQELEDALYAEPKQSAPVKSEVEIPTLTDVISVGDPSMGREPASAPPAPDSDLDQNNPVPPAVPEPIPEAIQPVVSAPRTESQANHDEVAPPEPVKQTETQDAPGIFSDDDSRAEDKIVAEPEPEDKAPIVPDDEARLLTSILDDSGVSSDKLQIELATAYIENKDYFNAESLLKDLVRNTSAQETERSAAKELLKAI